MNSDNMNVRRLFAVALIGFWAVGLSAQIRDGAAYDALYEGETVSSLKSHVKELSSAMMEGRKAGSEGEKMAAE